MTNVEAPRVGWSACTPDAGSATVTLGSQTFSWQAIGVPDRATPMTLGPRRPRPAATSGEKPGPAAAAPPAATRVFCIQPGPSLFPERTGESALVLAVSAREEQTFLRVEVYRAGALLLASDGAAPQHTLLLSGHPSAAGAAAAAPLFIVVSRDDAGAGPVGVTTWIEHEPLAHDTKFERGQGWFVRSLSEGSSLLYVADAALYRRLIEFSRCDWLSHDARQPPPSRAPNAPRDTTGCLTTQMTTLREHVYPFLSNLTGRSALREFELGQPRAALSEPMVVFFGLGGANRILLLDCRDTSTVDGRRQCGTMAEPWQTTLQRARYVWAVYIEDEQTPFTTSIDVEFKSKAPSVDYEEYDPRVLARPQLAGDGAQTVSRRVLRIGYRRLRVREPPVAVQVAFSRQGANYGLRQWVRVYRQFSARWWVVSGAVFLPALDNAISHVELEPRLPAEGGPAQVAQIIDDKPIAPIFATLIWRWPQVRSKADNQASSRNRLLVNLIPDIVGGMSLPPRRHNSYLVGGSWPILGDRLSFVMGAKIFRDDVPARGYAVGQYVPAATSIDEVRASSGHHANFVFGLAIELVRSR